MNSKPCENSLLEAELSLLNSFIINTVIQFNQLSCNVIYQEVKYQDLNHFSKSDKCGDFVVTSLDMYKKITLEHISTNPGVYQFVLPTQKVKGVSVEIKVPTITSYKNQMNSMCERFKMDCNTLWMEISQKHSFSKKFTNTMLTHHSSLPTMYTLV